MFQYQPGVLPKPLIISFLSVNKDTSFSSFFLSWRFDKWKSSKVYHSINNNPI
jgi:hypothetical protein